MSADHGRRPQRPASLPHPNSSPRHRHLVPDPLQPLELLQSDALGAVLAIVAIGLLGGLAGGLVGIGGSLLIIPALTLLFGRDQHLYQAAAMIVNAVVAGTATIRHARAKAIRADLLRRLLPATVLLVVVGVLLSNRIEQRLLQVLFGAFMLYVAASEGWSLLASRHAAAPASQPRRDGPLAVGACGATTGFVSGLLGIGGGGIGVPLLRAFCRVPLREAIAAVTATMLVSASVGAILKNIAFAQRLGDDRGLSASLTLAALLVPASIAGAWVGAALTHRLPLPIIRCVFVAVLLLGGGRMLVG